MPQKSKIVLADWGIIRIFALIKIRRMALLKFHMEKKHKTTPEERREALEFGKIGEQMTAKYLTDKGYIILEHNYRRGHLEIDLIALDVTSWSSWR